MKINWSEKQIKELIELYSQGKRLEDISKEMNINLSLVKEKTIELSLYKQYKEVRNKLRARPGELNGMYHRNHTEESLELMSKGHKGKPSWCKGLTKETDERLRKSGEKISITRKEKFKLGELISNFTTNNPMNNPEIVERVRIKSTGRKYSEEINKKKGRSGNQNAMSYPEVREIHKIACNNPERRAKHSRDMSGSGNPHFRGGEINSYGDDWKIQKQNALERDNFECQSCGKNKDTVKFRLEVDHIIPFRICKSNSLEGLQTLCRSCHVNKDGKFRTEENNFLKWNQTNQQENRNSFY